MKVGREWPAAGVSRLAAFGPGSVVGDGRLRGKLCYNGIGDLFGLRQPLGVAQPQTLPLFFGSPPYLV
jgi:hypothetical protein